MIEETGRSFLKLPSGAIYCSVAWLMPSRALCRSDTELPALASLSRWDAGLWRWEIASLTWFLGR